jgi:hypothetical protein
MVVDCSTLNKMVDVWVSYWLHPNWHPHQVDTADLAFIHNEGSHGSAERSDNSNYLFPNDWNFPMLLLLTLVWGLPK